MSLSERDWQRQVVDLARIYGYRSYHTYDSRRSAHGFPDLVLLKPGRLIFAELKTDKGRLTTEQDAWLRLLWTVPGVEAYLWRPGDFDTVAATLRGAEKAA